MQLAAMQPSFRPQCICLLDLWLIQDTTDQGQVLTHKFTCLFMPVDSPFKFKCMLLLAHVLNNLFLIEPSLSS